MKNFSMFLGVFLLIVFLAGCQAEIQKGQGNVGNVGTQSNELITNLVIEDFEYDAAKEALVGKITSDDALAGQLEYRILEGETVYGPFQTDANGNFEQEVLLINGTYTFKLEAKKEVQWIFLKEITATIEGDIDNTRCTNDVIKTETCNITNGTGEKEAVCNDGNWTYDTCKVKSCNAGYISSGGKCIIKVCEEGSVAKLTCDVANGIGEKNSTCINNTWSAFSACAIISCNTGYLKKNNVCAPKVCDEGQTLAQTCWRGNGSGVQYSTCSNNQWGAFGSCALTACYPGYTLINGVCYARACRDDTHYIYADGINPGGIPFGSVADNFGISATAHHVMYADGNGWSDYSYAQNCAVPGATFWFENVGGTLYFRVWTNIGAPYNRCFGQYQLVVRHCWYQ